MECRKQKARDWQVRLLEDVRHNTNGKFITLTLSNENFKKLAYEANKKTKKHPIGKKEYIDKNGKIRIRYKYKTITEQIELRGYETDNEIAKLAVRRFLERWRKTYKKSLRHWLVTELGHNGTENIHLHGIVWTNEPIEAIRKHWDYGYIWPRKEHEKVIKNYVNERTINYITKYVSKQDFQHKEYKAIILTSAGIGAGYMTRMDSKLNKYNGEDTKDYYVTRTGHKIKIPIYWRNKIYNDEERERLWLHKLDEKIRWIGKEKIDISLNEEEYYKTLHHYRQKNARLGYGNGTKDWNRKQYEEQRRILLQQERIRATEEIEAYPEWVYNSSGGSCAESATCFQVDQREH
ncbi:replication initiation protein [Tortoise microvirus 85]|nr:replication initiation protein [Tortoise microvirus 85]